MSESRNRNSVRWHVEMGDYFGTLATVLDLLRQSLDRHGYSRKDASLLVEVRKDLVFLQEWFGIVRLSGTSSKRSGEGEGNGNVALARSGRRSGTPNLPETR